MKSIDTYIPIDRRFALATGKTVPDKSMGAVLFADISGFTPMTEVFVEKFGPKRGAEELTGWLNKVYDALIFQIHQYRGSVINFSGDAIICWFDQDNGLRATTCGLLLQKEMARIKAEFSQTDLANPLGLKVAIAAGSVHRFVVGYPRVQLIEVLAGKTVEQMATVESGLEQGEVGVPQNVFEALNDRVQASEFRIASNEKVTIIKTVHPPAPPNPWPHVPPLDGTIARDWLLPPVYQRLYYQGAFLAELRPAVSLFLKFEGIDCDQDPKAGDKFDAFIRWVQRVLVRYHGYLLQVTTGDKGSYLYAVFGAPVALENNALRAVEAALVFREVPPELDFVRNITIGISQGQMHGGAYGAKIRRTYGVLGKEVNVAARLMSHNVVPGQVLVTRAVARATDSRFKFQDLGLVFLKGQTQPLPVFRVLYRLAEQSLENTQTRNHGPVIGRAAERKILFERLKALLEGQNSTVIIEGEAGIGKSQLVAELISQAKELGIPVLIGIGNQVEQNTAYFAWRPIFQRLFNIDYYMNGDRVRQRVLSWFEQAPDLQDRAPLLNILLPLLNLPENELTAQLTGKVRVNNTLDLLVQILNRAEFPVSAYLLILENVHRLDSASLALAEAVINQSVSALMLTVVTRPFEEVAPTAYLNLLKSENLGHLKLEQLSPDESAQLVCQQLGVDDISPDIATLIYEKAGGNPLFSEEIAYALRDQGFIVIEKQRQSDGAGNYAALNIEDLETITLPDTVQGAIINRVDQLSPSQQLTLKIASIIGTVFGFKTLQDIFPDVAAKDNLTLILDQVQKRNLVQLEIAQPELMYRFSHISIREVIYDLMTFEQRKNLHQEVATWYERAYHGNLAPHYSALAYHWGRAENKEKTLVYLEKAGERALRNGIFQQATYFFSQALSLYQPKTDITYAIWQSKLAQAQYELGQITQSRLNNERALAHLDRPIPKTRFSLWLKLGWELIRQFWPANNTGHFSGKERSKLVNTVSAYQHLFRIYFEENKRVWGGYIALRQVNIAEKYLGPSPELVRAYTIMGIASRFLAFQTLAETYFVKAAKIVEQLSHASNLRAMIWRSSSLYHIGNGQFQTVHDEIQRAIEIFNRLGDKSCWRDCMAIWGTTFYYTSDFKQSAEVMGKLATSGADGEIFLQKSWGLIWQGASFLRLGRLDESVNLLSQAASLLNNRDDGIATLSCWGLLAVAYWRCGDVNAAWEAADKAIELIMQSKAFSGYPFSLDGHVGVAEFYFALWESNNFERIAKKKIIEAMGQAVKSLHDYGGRYPIGRPSVYLYQGLYDWAWDRKSTAKQVWHKGLAAAHQLGMRYEQGRLLYELGRHWPANMPERQEYLLGAQEIFEELEAAYDLTLVHAERF